MLGVIAANLVGLYVVIKVWDTIEVYLNKRTHSEPFDITPEWQKENKEK